VQKLVAGSLAKATTGKAIRLAMLEAIASAEITQAPEEWKNAIAQNLSNPDNDVVRQAILAARALGADSLAEPLLKVGLDAARPDELRVAALCAASKSDTGVPADGFEFLTAQFARPEALVERLGAAEALGQFQLAPPQRLALARLVERASPLEISWLLRAFEQDQDAEIGKTFVETLSRSAALASVAPQRLRETLKNYPSEIQSAAEELVRRAAPDDRERAARVETLARDAANGDARLGEEVFFGQKAACAACHRVGSRGEKIGPELSKIGEIRARRDLAEAILFPSSSLARGYESFSVVTTAGQVHTGLLSRETAGAVYLRNTERVEIRVDRGDIEQLTPSATSIMPQGLEKTLSPVELRDLVAFLFSLK
jgi:putative heme-binding domain-containing protein